MLWLLLTAQGFAQQVDMPEGYGDACSVARVLTDQTSWTIHCEQRVRNTPTILEVASQAPVDTPFSYDLSDDLASVMADFLVVQHASNRYGEFSYIPQTATSGVLVQTTDELGGGVSLPLDTVIDLSTEGGETRCSYLAGRVMGAVHEELELPGITITVTGPRNRHRFPSPDFDNIQCAWPTGPASGRDILLSISDTINESQGARWAYHAAPFVGSEYVLTYGAVVPEIPVITPPGDTSGADTGVKGDTSGEDTASGDTGKTQDTSVQPLPNCGSHTCQDGKVFMCHKPGRTENTLCVSSSAAAAHLRHGDLCGTCE